MMIEPQKLEYHPSEVTEPCIVAAFPECRIVVALPVSKVIETAFNAMKSSSTDPFYRRQAWDAVKCYLIASLNLEDDKAMLGRFLMQPTFTESKIQSHTNPPYQSPDLEARKTLQTALKAMFVAAAIKDLRAQVISFIININC